MINKRVGVSLFLRFQRRWIMLLTCKWELLVFKYLSLHLSFFFFFSLPVSLWWIFIEVRAQRTWEANGCVDQKHGMNLWVMCWTCWSLQRLLLVSRRQICSLSDSHPLAPGTQRTQRRLSLCFSVSSSFCRSIATHTQFRVFFGLSSRFNRKLRFLFRCVKLCCNKNSSINTEARSHVRGQEAVCSKLSSDDSSQWLENLNLWKLRKAVKYECSAPRPQAPRLQASRPGVVTKPLPPYRVTRARRYNTLCYANAAPGWPGSARLVSCWINNADAPPHQKQVTRWPSGQPCRSGQVCQSFLPQSGTWHGAATRTRTRSAPGFSLTEEEDRARSGFVQAAAISCFPSRVILAETWGHSQSVNQSNQSI